MFACSERTSRSAKHCSRILVRDTWSRSASKSYRSQLYRTMSKSKSPAMYLWDNFLVCWRTWVQVNIVELLSSLVVVSPISSSFSWWRVVRVPKSLGSSCATKIFKRDVKAWTLLERPHYDCLQKKATSRSSIAKAPWVEYALWHSLIAFVTTWGTSCCKSCCCVFVELMLIEFERFSEYGLPFPFC